MEEKLAEVLKLLFDPGTAIKDELGNVYVDPRTVQQTKRIVRINEIFETLK